MGPRRRARASSAAEKTRAVILTRAPADAARFFSRRSCSISRKLRSFCETSSFQSFQSITDPATEIPRCMRVPHARSLPRSRCTARVAPECRVSPPRSRQARSRLSVAALRGRIRAARSARKGIRNPAAHAAGGGSVDGRGGVEARGPDRRDEPVCLPSCLRRAPAPAHHP